jgi:predicted phosphodiesterase
MPHDNDRNRFYRRLLRLVCVTLAVGGCAHPPQIQLPGPQGRVTKGPCLLRVDQDRAALMWETDVPGQWGVSCGTPGQKDRHFVSATEKVTYNNRQGGLKTAYVHKVWIEGLLPGRTYAYRLVGPEMQGDVFRFRTVAADANEVRFIVYGDSRGQPVVHRKLVRQMIKCNVDFVVNTGDLVSRGEDYPLWGPQFFDPLKGLMERVPIYAVKGNHEGRSGNYEKLLIPPGEQNSFGFDCGPVHYFCADNVSGDEGAARLFYRIVRDAEGSGAPWKFVSYHVPSVNFGGHWSDWQQGNALSAFANIGVDFVITGHSHQYERFRPVQPAGQTGGYVTYLTAGGGGAPLYPVEATALHACSGSAYHFCLFHIRGDMLTLDTIDPNGRVIDHVQVVKTNGRVDDAYTSTAVPAGSIRLHQSLYKGIGVTLSDLPGTNAPFVVWFDVTVPPLPGEARLTFELRCDGQAYQLPQAYTMTVPLEGGVVPVKLTMIPNIPVSAGNGRRGAVVPMEPPLWVDCRYECAGISEKVSRPVTVIKR